jgi:hypothetical protein
LTVFDTDFAIPAQGKYYFEWYSAYSYIGYPQINLHAMAENRSGFGFPNNTLISVGSTAGATTRVAIDFVNKKYWTGVNGTWNSGDPSTNTGGTPLSVTEPRYIIGANLHSYAAGGSPYSDAYMNFGSRPFAYPVPTGFHGVNTYNMPASTFTPDLAIVKSRSAGTSWGFYDRMRGAGAEIDSISTAADTQVTNGVTAFLNGGLSIGPGSKFNANGATYVQYMFKKGVTPGFDIVTYTGTGAQTTISHGLGAAPAMIIIKRLDTTNNWIVQHQKVNAAAWNNYNLKLNSSVAIDGSLYVSNSSGAGGVNPTSTVFSVGHDVGVNASNGNYVAYLFAEVPGFSKFGSYIGNGNIDGPLVNLGFKPAFVMIKRVDAVGNWIVEDSGRTPYNPTDNRLLMDGTNAESAASSPVDFLSNGFKQRNTDTARNALNGLYVYAAFAEQPLNFSTAK